ncbi:MAG: N-acyl-D-amino-acid deacylase family protein [Planctomycetota bacterium]|jgi:N-acyl-D-amino-acid deacylase
MGMMHVSAFVSLFVLLGTGGSIQDEAPAGSSVLVRNVRVIDGTGRPEFRGALRMADGAIVAVGEIEPAVGETVVDGNGLVLAPGFIDTHSHHDRGIFEDLRVEAAVSQGITTIVVGQDGGSHLPLSEFFARLAAEPPTVNVASYSGHGTVRAAILGDDLRRPATAEEIPRIAALVEADMDAGALGLSTGLEYASSVRASTDEVVALARVAAARGGRYISHLRSEDSGFWKALEEIILIGERTGMPVQVSHIKLAQVSSWGKAEKLIGRLDRARAAGVDITADIYPYTYWSSTIRVLFPDLDYDNPERAEFAVTEASTPEGIRLTRWQPEPALAGKTLAQIAAARQQAPASVLIELIAELDAYESGPGSDDGDAQSITAVSMTDEDISALLRWAHTNVCSDGSAHGRHPRGYGAFTRFFGKFVREAGALDLAEAVHKATGLSAAHVGIAGRGTLEPRKAADLVLFDPAAIRDNATLERPHALSSGIVMVWVNGEVAFEKGRVTAARAGVVVRRAEVPGRGARLNSG